MLPNHHHHHHDHVNGQKQIFKKPLGICSKNSNKKKKDEIPPVSSSVPYLNDDIMRYIFMRVPAISLFDNCRFLSKHCSQLICNQIFMKAHLLQSKPGILTTQDRKIQGENVKVFKFMEITGTQILKVHHLHTSREMRIFSTSGSLCIIFDYRSGNKHVVNFVTKESIPLPTPKQNDTEQKLVFDRANIKYKIVNYSRNYTRKDECVLTINVLDLDGSCKRIKGPKLLSLASPLLLNGVLYYEADKNGLFCLDLSTEKFWFIRWPINTDSYWLYEIMDVGGFLGFAPVDKSQESQETYVWILREEKWVLKFCPNKEQPIPGESWKAPSFLGYLGSDEDVFLFSRDMDRLDAYNFKTKQWMMIKPPDNNRFVGMHVTTILPLTSKMVS